MKVQFNDDALFAMVPCDVYVSLKEEASYMRIGRITEPCTQLNPFYLPLAFAVQTPVWFRFVPVDVELEAVQTHVQYVPAGTHTLRITHLVL